MAKRLSEEEKAVRKAARASKQPAPAVESSQESPASVEVSSPEVSGLSETVKVVDINGKKYNEFFNPANGTTRVELIVE